MSWTSVKQDILISNNQDVVFYLDLDGLIRVVTEIHANLFIMLEKLGLKCVPSKMMSVVTTVTMSPGNYTFTYNTNGVTGIANPQLTQTTHIIPDLNKEIEQCKRYKKGLSREDKKRWQYESRKHSRNTGRGIGRR